MSSPFMLNGTTVRGINYALGGKRANTFRCGYLSAKLFCYANGVEREISDLSITERKGATNSASFTARGGWEPQGGEEFIIQQGSRNRLTRMFGGTIIKPNETNISKPEIRIVKANLADWTWALAGDLVMGTFYGTYDEIAIELMGRYAPTTFTTRKVQRGLPTVSNGIEITDAYLPVALKRLAERGPGIVQYIDYRQDLYFRNDGARMSHPALVTRDNKTLKQFSIGYDFGQLVTRVYYECKGSTALADVAPGESRVPVNDASVFPETGLAKSGTQRFQYSGRILGEGGTVVGPGAGPGTAPVVALVAGDGIESGERVYVFVYVTLDGRTSPSPRTTIAIGQVAPPSTAVVAGAPTAGAGLDYGTHTYYPVARTAAGSTTAGPASNTVSAVAQIAEPNPGGFVGYGALGGGISFLDVGKAYQWEAVFVRDSDGAETAPSAPIGPITVAADTRYAVPSASVTSLPAGCSLRWYRTEGDGATFKRTTAAYEVVGSTGYFVFSGEADGSLGPNAPTSNSTGKGVCAVTAIPTFPSIVTHVDMYREFNNAGASTAKLAFSVTNGTTFATDTTPNSGLGATVPSTNTATANRAAVSVPAGPDGVIDIEVYRTNLSGDLKFVDNVGSNTAADVLDALPDDDLGGDAPTSDESELPQPEGQVAAGATEVVVADSADFEDGGGWAVVGNGRKAFRYGGKTSNSLTGVPASGPGSLEAPISYNSQITPAPQLTGVSSGSPDLGSITYTIPRGQEVNPVAQIDNLDAQALVRSIINGHSGIKAYPIQNRSLSYGEAQARGQAYLDRRSQVPASVPIVSKDVNYTAGALATVSLAPPTSVDVELAVQSVTITNFHPNPPVDPAIERPFDYQPDRTVDASTELLSVEDLLRQDARTT